MRTLIHAGTVVTVNSHRTILHDATIVVSENLIEAVLPPTEAQRKFPGTVAAARSLVAIPGFVQTHIHLCQTLFRGLADDLELLDWLRLKIFPLEAAHNDASMRASAMLGIAELVRSGTTTIMDMGSIHHEDEIIRVIAECGMRAYVGKAMMDVNDHYGKLRESTKDALQSSLALARQYHGHANGRIRYAFAPRFVLSCTEPLLRETAEAARSIDGSLIHTHAAENRLEIESVRSRCKMGNIEYFDHIGMLGKTSCLAHCIWLNPNEVGLLKQREAKVLHCPSSNLKLGSGTANVPTFLAEGIPVSLGADGAPCNNNLDMFSEMRLAALIQKPLHGPKTLSAQTVFEMATIGGASALGLGSEIGSIEPGKKADIVLLDTGRVWNPALQDELYSAIVYSCDPRNVHSVMVDGKWLFRDMEFTGIDEGAIVASGKRELQRLLGRVS